MVMNKHMDDKERRIVVEFCHLLEESKQRFNTLRDLPQYGHLQWHSFFDRTFEVYTKLWKFQQRHRNTLDCKYGLKRWQIGEIASKIGQLYYHYYLRTSEIFYLNEAFAFYLAIRGRSYYTQASREDRCDLMVKKLRYYARFIVVCLLLRRMRLVNELMYELDRQIEDYGITYDPDDQMAWINVVDEVRKFVVADSTVMVLDLDSRPVTLSYRLNPDTIPPCKIPEGLHLNLEEVVIVSGSKVQVKYSEMSIDMYRMIQAFEKEYTEMRYPAYEGSSRSKQIAPMELKGRQNPRKSLLFQPTVNEVLAHMACGCKDLSPQGIIMLYVSADGSSPSNSKTEGISGYDNGGLNMKKEPADSAHDAKYTKDAHCLYPGDMLVFTRRPLFIIIDSNHSFAFKDMRGHFGQPLTILMSPEELPQHYKGLQIQGSLFTQFLAAPLQAFCYCCDLSGMPTEVYKTAQSYVDKFFMEATRLFTHCNPDKTLLAFFGDTFLRPQLLRFIFCDVVLHLHRGFRSRSHRPTCTPPLAESDLLDHPTLVNIVLDLADYFEVSSSFRETVSSVAPAPSARSD